MRKAGSLLTTCLCLLLLEAGGSAHAFLPGSAAGPQTKAEQLAASGSLAEAEKAFAELEREGKLSPGLLEKAVEVSSRLNHWSRVVEILLSFRRQQPLPYARRLNLYEAYLRLGRRAAAEEELTSLVQERPAEEQLRHLLGFVYLSQNRFAEAAQVYTDYLERNPTAIESHINLALILFKLEKGAQALAHLKRAFEQDYERANTYFYRQLVRNMPPQELPQLAEDTKRELGLPADGIRAYLYVGREYENLLRYDSAIASYEHYLAAGLADSDVHLSLARLHFQTGNLERSQQVLAPLLERADAVGDSARLVAAELAVRAGDFDQASARLAALPSSLAASARYQYVAARVALAEGETARASELFQSVIQTDPDFAEAYFHLGQLYLRLGNPEKAKPMLEEFERRRR